MASVVNGSAATLTAVVIDDDPLVRRMVSSVLNSSGIRVLAEGASGDEAIELVLRFRPEVLLMDVLMPGMDGISATRAVLERRPEQVVVLLTGGQDDEMAVRALQAGAAGFLTKDLAIDSLPRALEGVVKGEPAVSRRTTMRVIEHLRVVAEYSNPLRPIQGPLTQREWEVLGFLRDGKTNDEIARELVVSIETVRTHVKHILRKLDVTSRRDVGAAAETL